MQSVVHVGAVPHPSIIARRGNGGENRLKGTEREMNSENSPTTGEPRGIL